MPKYTVELKRTEYVEVTIDATSRDEAMNAALEMICQSEDPADDFGGVCDGWEVISTMKGEDWLAGEYHPNEETKS